LIEKESYFFQVRENFSIKEASQILGVKPHILRYWENQVGGIRPRRKRGRRIYSTHDLRILFVIKVLLREEGYRLKRVTKIIREEEDSELFKLVTPCILREIRNDLDDIRKTIHEVKKKLERLTK